MNITSPERSCFVWRRPRRWRSVPIAFDVINHAGLSSAGPLQSRYAEACRATTQPLHPMHGGGDGPPADRFLTTRAATGCCATHGESGGNGTAAVVRGRTLPVATGENCPVSGEGMALVRTLGMLPRPAARPEF